MADPPKLRSIDFLSENQLRRKRELDRKNARLAREQTKAHIQNLELTVLQLEAKNRELERRLALCECRHGLPTPSLPRRPLEDAEWRNRTWGVDLGQMIGQDHPEDCTTWTTVLYDIMHASPPSCQTPPYSNHGLIATLELPTSSKIWSALPKYTVPTCPLDQVVMEIIRTRRPYESFGGNVQEFQKRPFPSIQSLLNVGDEMETEKSPVTSSIVRNIIKVMTVPTLPEQIAVLYFMGSLIRWLISPTEANYYGMPEWLRPTPAQISRPHPIWIDLFVWPGARERMCHAPKYHNENARMSEICNASISINWPYPFSDTLTQINGPGSEIVLTPTFARHIKDLKNWTVGPRILEEFPDLENEINIGLPREHREWSS